MSNLYKTQTRYLFHSDIKIKIPDKYDEIVFDELYSSLEDTNKKFNSYSKDSDIDKINKNNGNYVQVEQETVNILKTVIHFSNMLEDEYDITIMPLIRLWGFYKENVKKIPTIEDIEKVKLLVNYKNIQIDEKDKKIKIEKNQEIITGSFIKSYAVDKIIEIMRKKGINDAIINAGGSSIVSIEKWPIIVENPEGKELFEIAIEDEAYSTSNQANTYLKINGIRYGHIISPKTGYPSKNKQIGIITKNAFIGDIISTGLYNQTPQNFYKIIEMLSNEIKIEGYLIDENDNIYYSKGFENYIVK